MYACLSDTHTPILYSIVNDDYIGGQTTLTFLPGLTQLSLSVSIVNDDVLEMAEQFTAQLSPVDGGAIITQNTATVVISDNDRKLSV